MQTIDLSDTGVEVSALCLGTDYYGSRTPAATAYQLLDQFAEAGGAFVDTANSYAAFLPGFIGGESESTIGDWIMARQNRSRMFIATKLGARYPGTAGGLRASEIERECEKSLKRLKTERIDMYYAHCDDRNTPLTEIMEGFDRLVKAGKVRFIGASNWRTWRLAEARLLSEMHGWARHAALEYRHTYLRPKAGADFGFQVAAGPQLQDFCRAHKLTLVAYSILLSGAYTRPDRALMPKYVGSDSEARLSVLREIAHETGATANQVVIAWMLQSDPPVLPIIGASTQEQLTENMNALTFHLSAEQMARLQEAGA